MGLPYVAIFATLSGICTALSLKRNDLCWPPTSPATATHPVSVLVVIRHGGRLSSVAAHQNDGAKRQIYFRPSHEATLIYTPSTRVIEVCSQAHLVRQQVADTFATEVLGHNVSAKPLDWKSYDLTRFRKSFILDLPELGMAAITAARVIEADSRLSNWRQKLSLKVTFDDDIEAVAKRYLNGGQVFRHAGVSKVSIAIRYNLPGGKTKSLNITVTGWAGCNLRSVLDPVAQDIGYALLEHWGMMARLQPLSPDEQGHLMPLLIELYDHSNDDVTGKWLLDRGVAPRRLVEAGLLRRRERHDIILIDDDDQEVEIGPGAKLADVSLTTRHGEVLGPHDATEFEVYAIEREYLEELVVRQFRPLIKGIRPDRLDQNLLFLGLTECGGVRTPVYLARRLDSLEVLEKLNGLLWKRSGLGAGLVFCSGERVLSQIGSNIVMPVSEVLENDESAARLSIPAIANFHRTRRRATVSGLAVVLERYQHSAVLRIGEKATTLVGRQQITLIERLVRAHELDRPSVLTKELVNGMSISSPSQAFNRERWTSEIVGAFIEKVGKRDGWRLAVPIPSAVTSV